MHKIYISGKISGLDINEAKQLFTDAKKFLMNWYRESVIVNPFDINPNGCPINMSDDDFWIECMSKDIAALVRCQEIFMLRNWKDSKGAKLEHALACELDLIISYE